MSLFYGRMLLMLIHWQITQRVKTAKYKKDNKLLSFAKCLKSLQLAAHKITALIGKKVTHIKLIVVELIQLIAYNHDTEIKKGKINQQEIMEIIY